MPNWVKILIALLPKKALSELILSLLKDFAKKTKTKIDDEFLQRLDDWLRENKFLDPKKIEKLKEDLKNKATSQGQK